MARIVNVRKLKCGLSSYLDVEQEGEEIVVRDRDTPIARIVPLTVRGGDDFEEAVLVASGVMTLPQEVQGTGVILENQCGECKSEARCQGRREERDED